MPRPLRLLVPGGVYHVTGRGNRRQDIFTDDDERRLYLQLLELTAARYGLVIHAYCLMPNHVHLVVETPEPNLSQGMQYLHGRYAQLFNGRHGLAGHLFQGRFHCVPVETDGQLLALVRYVMLNPVRAGLCQSPAEWEWVSYRAYLGRSPAPGFLTIGRVLAMFGQDRTAARRQFSQFVFDAPPRAGP